jgi:hypothetical protein
MLPTPGCCSCTGYFFFTTLQPVICLQFDRKGLFLSRLNRREEAIESIILSIGGYPWNWSAWALLGRCIGDGEEVGQFVPLSGHD